MFVSFRAFRVFKDFGIPLRRKPYYLQLQPVLKTYGLNIDIALI